MRRIVVGGLVVVLAGAVIVSLSQGVGVYVPKEIDREMVPTSSVATSDASVTRRATENYVLVYQRRYDWLPIVPEKRVVISKERADELAATGIPLSITATMFSDEYWNRHMEAILEDRPGLLEGMPVSVEGGPPIEDF